MAAEDTVVSDAVRRHTAMWGIDLSDPPDVHNTHPQFERCPQCRQLFNARVGDCKCQTPNSDYATGGK